MIYIAKFDSVGSNPTASARNHASSRFSRLLALLFQFGTKPKPLSIASSKVSYEENRLSLYRDAEKETEDIFDRWTDEFDDLDEGYEPDKFFSD